MSVLENKIACFKSKNSSDTVVPSYSLFTLLLFCKIFILLSFCIFFKHCTMFYCLAQAPTNSSKIFETSPAVKTAKRGFLMLHGIKFVLFLLTLLFLQGHDIKKQFRKTLIKQFRKTQIKVTGAIISFNLFRLDLKF